MKFLTSLFLAFALSAQAAPLTNTVTFNWLDFGYQVDSVTNKPVKITPLEYATIGSFFMVKTPRIYTNTFAGQCIVTNMQEGSYRVELATALGSITTFTSTIPSTATGSSNYDATSFVSNYATNSGSTRSYSITVSDLRYPSVAGTNIVFTTNAGRVTIAGTVVTGTSPAVASNYLAVTKLDITNGTAYNLDIFTGTLTNITERMSTNINPVIQGAREISGNIGLLTNGTMRGTVLTNVNVSGTLSGPGDIGTNSQKFGLSSYAAGNFSLALGHNARAEAASEDSTTGNFGTAVGYSTVASGYGTALGGNASAIYDNSAAIGYNSLATAANQFRLGNSSNVFVFGGNGSITGNGSGLTNLNLNTLSNRVVQAEITNAVQQTALAGLTNSIGTKQFGSAALTNLSAQVNVATNIIGAGSGITVSSNNAGTWTITGATTNYIATTNGMSRNLTNLGRAYSDRLVVTNLIIGTNTTSDVSRPPAETILTVNGQGEFGRNLYVGTLSGGSGGAVHTYYCCGGIYTSMSTDQYIPMGTIRFSSSYDSDLHAIRMGHFTSDPGKAIQFTKTNGFLYLTSGDSTYANSTNRFHIHQVNSRGVTVTNSSTENVSITNGVVNATKGVILPASTPFTAPNSLGIQGAHLWSDGTNLCIVLQNSAGTRATNKVTMTAWP